MKSTPATAWLFFDISRNLIHAPTLVLVFSYAIKYRHFLIMLNVKRHHAQQGPQRLIYI